MLAYHCLNRNPKARPLMRDIVDYLEPLQVPAFEVSDDKATLAVIRENPIAEFQKIQDAN
ncbi:protein kinase superfamily protein [Actinidia rufa]|nr:protein kinase superfamily protein [Actinidia rufa]